MRKFARKKPHREMMLKNLVTSAIIYESIKTTLPKAKETRRLAEKAINLGKKNNLVARRQLSTLLNDKNAVKKVFEQLAPRYQKRVGGYFNIFRVKPRPGDAAQMAILRLIPETPPANKPKESTLPKKTTKDNGVTK